MRVAIIVAFFSLSLPSALLARNNEDPKVLIYGNFGVDIGLPTGIRLTASCLFLKHHELSVGYNYYSRRGQHIPGNYDQRGFFNNDIVYPQQTYSGVRATYGYVMYPHRRADKLRYVVGGGIAYGMLSSPYDYQKVTTTGIFSFSNWTNKTQDREQGQLLLHASLQFTPCRGIGFNMGPYAVLGEDYNGGGINFGILFGRAGNHIFLRDPVKRAASRARHRKKMFWLKSGQ
jgi:hypothetical protein